MKIYSVTDALIFLNQIMPGQAPRNEETLRRAIRRGELKAAKNLGREGSKIKEDDLIEYSKLYKEKYFSKSRIPVEGLLGNSNYKAIKSEISALPTLTDLMKQYLSLPKSEVRQYKIDLLEMKRQWMEKKNTLELRIKEMENELAVCKNEIKAFDDEIEKLQ